MGFEVNCDWEEGVMWRTRVGAGRFASCMSG